MKNVKHCMIKCTILALSIAILPCLSSYADKKSKKSADVSGGTISLKIVNNTKYTLIMYDIQLGDHCGKSRKFISPGKLTDIASKKSATYTLIDGGMRVGIEG